MAEVNSFALLFGATYPSTGDVVNTAPTYGDPINVLNGTLDVTGNPPVFPPEGDVRLGIQYGTQSQPTLYTGNVRVPPVESVEAGYRYDSNDQLVGLLQGGTNYPLEGDVRKDIIFGSGNEYVGNYLPALEQDVRAGIRYGALGIEYTGTLSTSDADAMASSDLVLQDITAIRGDSYQSNENRAFVWNANDNYPWPDLTDATLSLRGVNDLGEFEYVPVVSQPTQPNQSITLELTSSESDVASGLYRYDIVATLSNGNVHTLARGDWTWQLKYAKV